MSCEWNRWSLAAFLIVVFAAGPAFAGHGEQELTFDDIEVSVTGGDQLRLTYEIEKSDWSRLEHDGVHPELNIYVEHEDGGELKYAYNFDVASRHGSFTLPSGIDAFDLSQFQVEVLGFAEAWRIRRLSARGVSGARLAFRRSGDSFSLRAVGAESCRLAAGDADLSDTGSSEPSDGTETSEESDDSQGSDESDESEESEESDQQQGDGEESDDASSPPNNWKAKVIQACNDATEYDSEMESCTKLAMDLKPRWAADTVETCGEVFEYNSEFETCLEKAERYETHDPSEVVEVCSDVSDYSSERETCIETGAEYTNNPVPIIEACTEATSYESDRETCIELGQKLGDGGAAIIRACSGRSVEECINSAAAR